MFGNGASMCGLPAGNGSKQFGLGLMAYAIGHHSAITRRSKGTDLWLLSYSRFMNGNFAKESKLVVLLLAVFNFMSGDYSKPVTRVEGSAKQRAFYIFFNFAWACQFVIYMMKPNDWPYYNSDDKSVYLLAILFLSWCSENLSNPPTSTAAGLKTFFWVIVLTNVSSIVFMHGMQFAEWKDVNKDVWVSYI